MNVKSITKSILYGIGILLLSLYSFYLYLFFTLDNSPFHSGECPSIETFGDIFMWGFVCRGIFQVIIVSGGILAPFAIIVFVGSAIGFVIFISMQIYKYVFQHSKLTYDDFHIITSIILLGISILFLYFFVNVAIDNWFINYLKH